MAKTLIIFEPFKSPTFITRAFRVLELDIIFCFITTYSTWVFSVFLGQHKSLFKKESKCLAGKDFAKKRFFFLCGLSVSHLFVPFNGGMEVFVKTRPLGGQVILISQNKTCIYFFHKTIVHCTF